MTQKRRSIAFTCVLESVSWCIKKSPSVFLSLLSAFFCTLTHSPTSSHTHVHTHTHTSLVTSLPCILFYSVPPTKKMLPPSSQLIFITVIKIILQSIPTVQRRKKKKKIAPPLCIQTRCASPDSNAYGWGRHCAALWFSKLSQSLRWYTVGNTVWRGGLDYSLLGVFIPTYTKRWVWIWSAVAPELTENLAGGLPAQTKLHKPLSCLCPCLPSKPAGHQG